MEENITYLFEQKRKDYTVQIVAEETYIDIKFLSAQDCYYTYRVRDYDIIPSDKEEFFVDQSEITSCTWRLKALANGDLSFLPMIFQSPPYCTKIQNAARTLFKIPHVDQSKKLSPLAGVFSLIFSQDWSIDDN
jgi:hypothetical protein